MMTLKPGHNIFDYPADALVNPVNCRGAMGAGLALFFKQRYPKMARLFAQACNAEPGLKPGQLWVYEPELRWPHPNFVVCVPTKDDWRKPSELSFVIKGLEALKRWLEEDHPEVQTVGIPALGCGLGGLSWQREVSLLLEAFCAAMPQRTFLVYPPIDIPAEF